MSTLQSNPSGLTPIYWTAVKTRVITRNSRCNFLSADWLIRDRKRETTYKVDLLKRLGQGICTGTKSTDNDSSDFVQWEMIPNFWRWQHCVARS
ncbi:hypothetical protein CDAR_620241 [Caerostris darwini]|uniref:Uncharacterized protein n=1 Tax=Caerostris darwini TaxID=1538125 RepID=A0AAV4VLH0_9ARAC|nr:hypothetical protein CDAR_620241 [Caerostris darwini]